MKNRSPFILSIGSKTKQEMKSDHYNLLMQYLKENSIEIVNGENTKKADAVLIWDKDDFTQDMIQKGIVPIISEESGYEGFNAQKETGNAFTFTTGNIYQCIAALTRASINYEFPYDWSILQKNLKKKTK